MKRKLLLVNSLEWTSLRNDDAKVSDCITHGLRLYDTFGQWTYAFLVAEFRREHRKQSIMMEEKYRN